MARHKNHQWNLAEFKPGEAVSFETAKLAVLMDIRDELHELNNNIRRNNYINEEINRRLKLNGLLLQKRSRKK